MASFTDTIPTFSPYVQQLPVEAMVQVGQQKQNQYNQGIEKIQSNIDQISGLPIGRDADKAYVQSKINELGNNLKTFMASDFSDAQLVNSVNGMTGQISKDPYVRAAVYSTANDAKQMDQMEKDKQAGKLTPHAEYNYQLKRNQYYNNPDLKTKDGKPINFSGTYDQSWDIDKNLIDAVKGVGDSKWSADIVFKTDSNGQFIKDKNGIPILSEYAIREKREGKFNENITAAIDSVLNRPEARKELSMRGVYNYRDFDDINAFVRSYEYQKQKGMALNNDKKLELLSKITTEKDPVKVEQYKSMVNKIDGDMVNLSNSADLMIAQAEGYSDANAYKAALETQKIRNDYRTAFVTEQYTKEYIENIPYNAAQKKIQNERDWWSKQQTVSMGWANVGISKDRLQLEKDKWAVDPKNPNKPGLPPGNLGEFGLAAVDGYDILKADMVKSEELVNSFSTEKRKVVADYLKAINFANGKDVENKEVNETIDLYLKTDPDFIDRFYEKAKKDVTDHPDNTYFSNLATSLPSVKQLERDVYVQGKRTDLMNNSEGVIASGEKEINISELGKGFKPFTISYEGDDQGFLAGGKRGLFQAQEKYTKTVDAQDVLNASIVAKYKPGLNSLTSTYRYVTASDSERLIYNKAKKQLEDKFKVGAGSILWKLGLRNDASGVMVSRNPQVDKFLEAVNSKKFNDVLTAKAAYLKERSMDDAPIVATVYKTDATGAEIKSTNDRIGTILNTFKDGDMDVSEFSELMKGNKEYIPTIKIDRKNGKIELALYNGEELVKAIPITNRQMQTIKPELNQIPSLVSEVQRQIAWNKDTATTNLGGYEPTSPNAYKNAYYPSTHFVDKFNRKDIMGADIKINGKGQPNVYFYIKEGGSVKGIPLKIPTGTGDLYPFAFDNVDEANDYILSLSTSGQIDNIINNSKSKK